MSAVGRHRFDPGLYRLHLARERQRLHSDVGLDLSFANIVFDEAKHPRLHGKFAHVQGYDQVKGLHEDHALAVLHKADKINNFQGAQNHVQRFEHDPKTHTVTIHYRQRSTYHHPTASAAYHEAQMKQAFEGSMLKTTVPEPEHVPNAETAHRALKGTDARLLESAVAGGRSIDQERRQRIANRFRGGKQTPADITEARRSLKVHANRMKNKPSGPKAAALADRIGESPGGAATGGQSSGNRHYIISGRNVTGGSGSSYHVIDSQAPSNAPPVATYSGSAAEAGRKAQEHAARLNRGK